MFIVQEKGMTNWFDIAVLLGRNRTPFQCLARYQRSLNARILKSEWTNEDDNQLRIAVETFGENDWQSVASTLVGRTGPQCSNRWKKTLHPNISRTGRWTLEESKRLKVAVMLFGPKNWGKIAQFVPGRTGVKCREKWFNCLNPSLKVGKWTEEEDSRLKAAIEECGYCWAKVAKFLSPRTDSECQRRWKVLFPHEVPLLQAARRTQKAAMISNFVDRESERPALGPHDFVPVPMIRSAPEPKDTNKLKKPKRKISNTSRSLRSTKPKEGMHISSMEDPGITNGTEVEKLENDTGVSNRGIRPCSSKICHTEPVQDDLMSNFGSTFARVANVKGCDSRKKKKLPKSHPKRNELIRKEIGKRKCQLMSNHQGLEPGVTNADSLQITSGDNATSGEEERVMLSGAIAEISKLSCDHLDDKVSKASKCTSERNIETAGEGNVASVPCQIGRRIRSKFSSTKASSTDDEDNVRLSSFVASVSCQPDGRKRSKPRSKSCSKRSSGVTDEDNVTLASLVASVPCQSDGHKRSKLRSKSCSKRVLDTINEDNISPNGHTSSEGRSKSCLKRTLDTDDEDNDTLASFLRPKSKKKRAEPLEIDNQTSSPSSMKHASELVSKH